MSNTTTTPNITTMRKALVATGELTRDQVRALKGEELRESYRNLVVNTTEEVVAGMADAIQRALNADEPKATPAKGKVTAKATTKKATTPKKDKTTSAAPSPLPAKVKGVQHPGTAWLARMEAAGLSQTKAAAAMGVAPMTLNRLVNGYGIPTAKVTVAFAKAVDADVREVWAQVCDYELALALSATNTK